MSAKNIKSVVAMAILLAFVVTTLGGLLPRASMAVVVVEQKGKYENVMPFPAHFYIPLEGCSSPSGECPLG